MKCDGALIDSGLCQETNGRASRAATRAAELAASHDTLFDSTGEPA